MKIDWTFAAKDLAAHLAATKEAEAADRLISDAERDAARLTAPVEFWSCVADEYERRSLPLGAAPSETILATLRRLRQGLR